MLTEKYYISHVIVIFYGLINVTRWYSRCWKRFEKAKLQAKLKLLSFWNVINTILKTIALLKISIFYLLQKENTKLAFFFTLLKYRLQYVLVPISLHLSVATVSSPCSSSPSPILYYELSSTLLLLLLWGYVDLFIIDREESGISYNKSCQKFSLVLQLKRMALNSSKHHLSLLFTLSFSW